MADKNSGINSSDANQNSWSKPGSPSPTKPSRIANGKRNSSESNRDRGRGGRGNRGGGHRKDHGRGRGGSNGRGGRQRGEAGRAEWSRNPVDKRQRNNEEQAAKRRKLEQEGQGALSVPFSQEEIAAEERRPKRKVAVLIGYAGSGYKGMQINATERTIEGDIFKAFIAAGAISKANADDPKKSSLVRCARTDKGVHAAGNVISLKLIVDDPDVVKKINHHLPPQIRVWGIERTNGSFSCYQACDSRWYEYLIPTYSFLPPHPQSYLGKKLLESANAEGVIENYQSLQKDVASFWEEAEKTYVNPILDRLDAETRAAVVEAIHSSEEDAKNLEDGEQTSAKEASKPEVNGQGDASVDSPITIDERIKGAVSITSEPIEAPNVLLAQVNGPVGRGQLPEASKSVLTPVEIAVKEVKAAYIKAKKAYRISSARRQRVQDALSTYIGTRNFHNYTIQKTFRDPSAKRVIRSFKVGNDPIIINDTEWLSLKVHGQSFMMHQIRKMVAMAALIVRCGCPMERMNESYGSDKLSIPKAPGLGLLLERPVFDSYNERAVNEFEREKIDFDKFEKEISEFKQQEIYERIFREEEKDHQFHIFFHHIDHYRTDAFLWVTATGISAAAKPLAKGEGKKAVQKVDIDSDDEVDAGGEEG